MAGTPPPVIMTAPAPARSSERSPCPACPSSPIAHLDAQAGSVSDPTEPVPVDLLWAMAEVPDRRHAEEPPPGRDAARRQPPPPHRRHQHRPRLPPGARCARPGVPIRPDHSVTGEVVITVVHGPGTTAPFSTNRQFTRSWSLLKEPKPRQPLRAGETSSPA